MSMITEQIKKLRERAKGFFNIGDYDTSGLLKDAADTIEQLAKKAKGYNTVYFTPIDTEAYKKALEDIKAEITEEKECAYADFERYKVEYLGQDWEDALDSLPHDDFRYGMERCLEIISKHNPYKVGRERA